MFLNTLISILSLACCTHALTTPLACNPTGVKTQGFTAKFYEYPLQDFSTYRSIDYLTGGYKELYYFGKKSGITDINISDNSVYTSVVQGELYGFPVSISNFTIEFSGYYIPPITGLYRLNVGGADDSIAVMFGAGEAFTCCDPDGQGDGSYSLYYYLGYNYGIMNAEVYLTAGKAYPIKVVWSNLQTPYSLLFRMVYPTGLISSVFNNVYTFEDTDESCFIPNPTKTLTSTWINEVTSLSTSLYSGVGTDIVEIFVPIPTTTDQWLESYATTYTTVTVVTESGSTVTEDIVVVETPEAIIRTTQAGSGVFATTYTTETIITGSGGVEETDILVVVETPTQTLTTTVPWSSDFTSSFTSEIVLTTTVVITKTQSVIGTIDGIPATTSLTTFTTSEEITYTEPLLVIEIPITNSEYLLGVSATFSFSMAPSSIAVEYSSTQDSSIIAISNSISSMISSTQESSSGFNSIYLSASSTHSSSSESSLVTSNTYSTQQSTNSNSFDSISLTTGTSSGYSHILSFSQSEGIPSDVPSANIDSNSGTIKPTSISESSTQSMVSNSHSNSMTTYDFSSQIISESSSDISYSYTLTETPAEHSSGFIASSSQVLITHSPSDINSYFGKSSFSFKNSTQGTLTLTSTNTQTTVITITSCSDNLCVLTAVSVTPKLTTVTENGKTTIHTTYCPISSSKKVTTNTAVVTITSCSNNKCFESTVPGSQIVTSEFINGETTIYTTFVPLGSSSSFVNSAKHSESTSVMGEYGEETKSSSTVTKISTTSLSTSTSTTIQRSTIYEYQGSGSVTNPLLLLLLIPFTMFF